MNIVGFVSCKTLILTPVNFVPKLTIIQKDDEELATKEALRVKSIFRAVVASFIAEKVCKMSRGSCWRGWDKLMLGSRLVAVWVFIQSKRGYSNDVAAYMAFGCSGDVRAEAQVERSSWLQRRLACSLIGAFAMNSSVVV